MKRIAILVLLFALSGCVVNAPTPSNPTPPPTAVATSASCFVGDQIPYVYHSYRLTLQADCIVVVGRVEAVRVEADGDRHVMVRLEPAYSQYVNAANGAHQSGDLVVEPICVSSPSQADAQQPCAGDTDPIKGLPNIGDCIQAEGRYVLDTDHYSLADVHPLGKWSPSTQCAANVRSLGALHFEDPQGD